MHDLKTLRQLNRTAKTGRKPDIAKLATAIMHRFGCYGPETKYQAELRRFIRYHLYGK